MSLIELMSSLTLLAILGSIAVPGFNAVRYDSERSSAVNSFLHSIFLARSEAIKRGTIVSLCKSQDAQQCSGSAEWHEGWMIFANDDGDEPPRRDPDETIIWVHSGWAGGSIRSNRNAYSFRPVIQGVVNGTVVFCDPRGGEHARAIIISHTGRPRLSRRDPNNRPLKCLNKGPAR